MADLREAFLQAAANNPDSEIGAQVGQIARAVTRDEHQDARFQTIGRKFNSLGNAAYQLSANSFRYRGERNMEILKGQWRRLMADFSAYPPQRKEELLHAFAEGLHLMRDGLDPRHRDILETGMALGNTQASRLLQIPEQFKVNVFTGAVAIYEDLKIGQIVVYQAQVVVASGGRLSVEQAIETTAKLLPIRTPKA